MRPGEIQARLSWDCSTRESSDGRPGSRLGVRGRGRGQVRGRARIGGPAWRAGLPALSTPSEVLCAGLEAGWEAGGTCFCSSASEVAVGLCPFSISLFIICSNCTWPV